MIGRKKEIDILEKALASNESELVAVIGRRRVGKTYLIRTFFKNIIDFEMVGLKDGGKEQQLRNFTYSLAEARKHTGSVEKIPKDWLEAFHELSVFLESKKQNKKGKQVVFIDELPWAATAKSGFLTGFSYFWNSYASKNNIIVVICGSAASWMIEKVINDKGGLHNRVTRRLFLQAFSLAETEEYFQSKNVLLDRYQIVQIYMAMGGIPLYLEQVENGKTAAQNINEICFHPQGLLRTEFENLYSSLFAKPERYEHIVRALATKWKGLNRNEILKTSGLKDGGGFSTYLKELEQSGFITSYVPFGKNKKDSLFRLTDNYSLFYLKFITGLPPNQTGNWLALGRSQSWKAWSGYAFENICFQHIENIKMVLGISGVHTRQFSFMATGTNEREGTQIDMLIDRMDNAISICEAKFYDDEYFLTKENAEKLRKKKSIFRQVSKTKKQLFVVLITSFGLRANKHSVGLIDNVVSADDLFQ